MPSSSVVRTQACAAAEFISDTLRHRGLRRLLLAYGEVAKDGAMVGEAHVRHFEIGDFYFLARQHEVELDARIPRRKRGQVLFVGAAQPRGAHEEIDLVRAPEGIEIAGHDDRLVRLDDEIVQVAQLVLALPVLEREVDEENADIVELELDDQPLDAGVEVVEALALDARRSEKGVALLAYDGHEVVERTLAVLALIGAVVAQGVRNVFGLVHHARADRADVD